MRYKFLLAVAALPFLSQAAIAQIVTLDCGSMNENMTVRYAFGRKAASAKQSVDLGAQIRPKVCPGSGPCNVTATISKELSCRKPLGVFRFKFKPVPFNSDLQGQCGGRITGEVSIYLNGKTILAATEFESTAACFSGGDEPPEISSITVGPDGSRPLIARARVP